MVQLLQVAIENHVLDVGLFGLIWNNTRFVKYSLWCSHHSWIYHVCAFNNENEISLAIPHATFTPKRINDRASMDIASDFLSSGGEFRAFNRVRMRHNVVFLSDITTANGRSIDRLFTASSEFEEVRNNFECPSKHYVSSSDYTLWCKTLEYIFPNEKLATPLGPWTLDKATDWLDFGDWFVTPNGEFLYLRNSLSEWHRYVKQDNAQYSYHFEYLVENAPPDGLHRAMIEGNVNSLYFCNSSALHSVRTADIEPPIQLGNLQVLAPSINWVTEHLLASPSLHQLVFDIANGKALVAVCYESYFESWVLSSADGSS